MNIPQALDRLCYRYPSMLVDAITEHEPGRRLAAVKNVTVNEPFFTGHYPGTPMMPGPAMAIMATSRVAVTAFTPCGAGRTECVILVPANCG